MHELKPFVTYEETGMAIEAMRGKIMIEDVIVAYPEDMGGPERRKRYTLFPGALADMPTYLELSTSNLETDEGYEARHLTIKQGWLNEDHDDVTPAWEIEFTTDARDCDGQISHHIDLRSPGGIDTMASEYKPDESPCDKVGSHKRDYEAEKAGY